MQQTTSTQASIPAALLAPTPLSSQDLAKISGAGAGPNGGWTVVNPGPNGGW